MAKKKRKKRLPKSQRKKKPKNLPQEEEYTYDRSPPKTIRVANYDNPLEEDEIAPPLDEEENWIEGEYPEEEIEERSVKEYDRDPEEDKEEYFEEEEEYEDEDFEEEEGEPLSREELKRAMDEEREEVPEEEREDIEEEEVEAKDDPDRPETEEERLAREQRLEELKTYWDQEDEEDDFDGYPIVVKGAPIKDPRLDKPDPPQARERKAPKEVRIDPNPIEEDELYEEDYDEEYEEEATPPRPREQYVEEEEEIWEEEEEEERIPNAALNELRQEMENLKRRHRRFRFWLIFSIFLILLVLAALAWFFRDEIRDFLKPEDKISVAEDCIGIEPDFKTSVPLESLVCKPGVVSGDATLEDILLENQVDFRKVVPLLKEARNQDLAKVALGSPYAFFHEEKKPDELRYFVYQSGPSVLVWMDLSAKPKLTVQRRKSLGTHLSRKTIIIKDNMAETMYNLESGLEITRMLEEALKWQVDFFYLESGDRFDLVYEEEEFEGGGLEVGDLKAVRFQSRGEDVRAYRFERGDTLGYYDFEGQAVKREFLKAPVRFGHISSPFDYKRPDPFSEDGEIRPHLGTDYAAPLGTPIMAVADGVVEAAAFSEMNGNYVKLRHDGQIQTQYLHMRNFAEGIRYGTKVRQGDIIGFVGNTGRSTGPHVCYRFWKNGVQVDPRKEQVSKPIVAQLPEEEMDLYKAAIRKARELLLQ